MPTFSCPQCGATFTASHKPNACSQCSGRQIRTNRNGPPSSGNLAPPKLNRNGPPSSGNLSQPKLRRSPISEPTSMTELNSSASESKAGYQKGNSGPGLGLGFNIFSPSLIMTWLLILTFPVKYCEWLISSLR